MAGVPQISKETTEQVLAATDIVDVIGSYIEVKRAGTAFKALCPFHNEKSPSFNINPQRQFFHCFGCGKSGNAITFVREYENLPFPDAVKKLAARAGISVQEEVLDPREDRARRLRGRLLDIHREATSYMHRLLMRSKVEAQHARDYMQSRGFGSEMAARWGIGWAPAKSETFFAWARSKGYTAEDLLEAGLARQGERGIYTLFRDRLMFPIRNEHGDVVGFSGRHLHPDQGGGKYVNSPETALFKKASILFALDRARRAILKDQFTLICEGQIDVIVCHEHGIENAVAGQGTAFTPQHAQLLSRYSKQAVLCYDADNAGIEAARKAFQQLAPENIGVRMIRMPAGEDPDSFIRKNGADAFRELIATAPDFFDAIMDQAVQEGRMETPESRALLQREYAPLLSLVADAGMRDAMINKVGTRLRSGSVELRGAVAREKLAATRKAARPVSSSRHAQEETAPAAILPGEIDPIVGYLCSLALHSAAAQEWLGEQFETLHEARDYLQGVPILEAILAARPNPEVPAAVNTFLAGLPEEQRLGLYADSTFHASPPDDVHAAVENAMAQLSAKWLMIWDARIKADLSQPGLPLEQIQKLMAESKEISKLVAGLKQRFVFDERYAKPTRRQKSGEGGKFPFPKRERNS